jgi:hypothetical protein
MQKCDTEVVTRHTPASVGESPEWTSTVNTVLYIVKLRLVLLSERAPHINKPASVWETQKSVLSPKWVLDAKTDRPIDSRS